jgi:hypothetical protein
MVGVKSIYEPCNRVLTVVTTRLSSKSLYAGAVFRRFRLIKSSGGISAALNTAIGCDAYWLRMDADDIAHPDRQAARLSVGSSGRVIGCSTQVRSLIQT